MTRSKRLLFVFVGVLLGLGVIKDVQAVSQWSRKYKVSCTACHTSFPRLNYYGERFMRNGFQDPDSDTPDGGTLLKETRGNMDIGRLGDLLGFRISVKPVIWEKKKLAISHDEKKQNRVSIGKFDWIQFFTAGPITKNISFFNELEFQNADDKLHHGWFILGLHNLFDSQLVNFQVGKISPVEWTSFSNRLRIFPEVSALVDKVTVSGGQSSGEDSTTISSGQFGANYYGYAGPVVWAVGVGNAKSFDDVNQYKNVWSSLRLEVSNEDSALAGSSASLFWYHGIDTAFSSTNQRKNNYFRLQPSVNVRWRNWDIVGSYHMAEEDNFRLGIPEVSEAYDGGMILVSHILNSKFQLGGQYDFVRQDFKHRGNSNIEDQRALAHVSCLVRDNFNVILTGILDLQEDSDDDKHTVFMMLRSMF